MDNKKLDSRWVAFLKLLQRNGFPDAVIAGGAVRDTVLDREVKDIDIFIMHSNKARLDYLNEILGIKQDFDSWVKNKNVNEISLLVDVDEIKESATEKVLEGITPDEYISLENYDDTIGKHVGNNIIFSNISRIFNVKYQGLDYQLLFVNKDPLDYINEDFDYGICKIFYDGKEIVASDEFEHDHMNKALTLHGAMTKAGMWRSIMHHGRRIQNKYNWPIVIGDDVTELDTILYVTKEQIRLHIRKQMQEERRAQEERDREILRTMNLPATPPPPAAIEDNLEDLLPF